MAHCRARMASLEPGLAQRLLEPRLAQRLLALRPAHSRGHQCVTRYPKASDISSPPCLLRLLPAGANRRVGLAPTGKRRLVTAHTRLGHCTFYLVAARSMPFASTTAAVCGPARNCRIVLATFASL